MQPRTSCSELQPGREPKRRNTKVTPLLPPEILPEAKGKGSHGVVHTGQPPRAPSRMGKELERAEGRIQHNYTLSEETQSSGTRWTHKQINFNAQSN